MTAPARSLGATAFAAAMLTLAGPGDAQDARSLEFGVKATYLYKFAPFVEWPSSVFPSPTSPLHLCVAGTPVFGELLDRAVAGQRFNEHPIELDRFPTIDGPRDCQIMFVSGSPAQPAADILALLRDAPVLTVTDLPSESANKGIINFVIRDHHVRFEIDARAAAAHHLEISSKLLALAVSPARE